MNKSIYKSKRYSLSYLLFDKFSFCRIIRANVKNLFFIQLLEQFSLPLFCKILFDLLCFFILCFCLNIPSNEILKNQRVALKLYIHAKSSINLFFILISPITVF